MPRQQPEAPTFDTRQVGWNAPNEPVKWWPLFTTIVACYLLYRYSSYIGNLFSIIGIDKLYGFLWGNRMWVGSRISVVVALIWLARLAPYHVELGIEMWGSWITTGTFSKARTPTLHANVLNDRTPYGPALGTVITLFVLIELARSASVFAYLGRLLWSERSWLGFAGIIVAFLGIVAVYGERINQELVNFDLWINKGVAMFGKAAPTAGTR
jgi:hypothetical protein